MRGRLPPTLWSAFRDQGSETVKRGENGKPPPLPKLASDDGEGPTTTTAPGADSEAWVAGDRRAVAVVGMRGGWRGAEACEGLGRGWSGAS
ncbi:hypothetical protein ES332_D10G218000v1 [Gossypium tomentosum]|uniref:Uncharacterized protein n=1 Tax=Gossypium tomentosum TaxID=34277 RepID=A0A5D2J8F4_GOSTO|nr:hypothetical protein ES332_D10G218000v1 [Gossypium tomentosum]